MSKPDRRVILPGERTALVWMRTRCPNMVPTFFDVGGNVGDWGQEVVDRWDSECWIYAFEPQPEASAMYHDRFPHVFVETMALGSEPGEVEMQRDTKASYHASLHRRSHPVLGQFKQTISVKVITLDDYCVEAGIGTIDFLKIDVEGHEMAVLDGSRRMLANGNIDVIQFEFNGNARLAGVQFWDFWALANNYGYRLVRENPGYLEPLDYYSSEYELTDEDRNFLLVRKSADWWWH